MHEINKKTTIPKSSAATDVEQSFIHKYSDSIVEKLNEGKSEIECKKSSRLNKNASDSIKTISMTELYDTIFKSNPPLIDNLLYTGTYLFVGAPKVGKSFFMAQLGYHISKGLTLWGYDVKQCTVLYLALEDGYERLQSRLFRMFGTECTDNFLFAVTSKQVDCGLENQLNKFIQLHPDTRLIIIDTLQKVREFGKEKFSYSKDYEIVTQLKNFEDAHRICLLLVHHTRKQTADDSFDTISGTNGLLGAADGAFILQKDKRTDNKAFLDIVGRDQQDQRLNLEFNRTRCIWELIEAETEILREPPDSFLEAVSKLITPESPEWSGTASELSNCLKPLDITPNALTRRLNVNANKLLSEYSINYESSRNHKGRQVKLFLN